MGRCVARLRASSGVCVPTQLSEIAPAKHLLKISSLFLLVPVWVDFTRKEGVSLALSLSTPLPEPFRVPGPFLFTKLAHCSAFPGTSWPPMPSPRAGPCPWGRWAALTHCGPLATGLPCCLKCLCGRVPSLGLTVTVASRSLCGDTLWFCTAGHPAHSPAALGLLPLQHWGPLP